MELLINSPFAVEEKERVNEKREVGDQRNIESAIPLYDVRWDAKDI